MGAGRPSPKVKRAREKNEPSDEAARRAERAGWTLTRYASLDDMKADEYRYWQSRPAHERLGMVSELARQAYGEDAGGEDGYSLD